jgi:phosphoglycolate phosphatase-like HAD superfamily hydrolase
MQLKALLFDLDGTLADTLPLCIQSYQHAFAGLFGRPFSEEEITAHFGLTETGIFQRIAPDQWEQGLQDYFRYYEEHHIECREPFPGITAVLDFLTAHGVSLAVVTGKGAYSANYSLNYLGLSHYFTLVSAGSEDAIIKSQSIRDILTTWQIDPHDAAYIGDADTDIREAELAGVLPLGAQWSSNSTIHRLAKMPELTFASIPDFLHWLHTNLP